MMECKKALSETENDYEKATEWLRKNGSAKAASKLAGRDATEGLVGIAFDEHANGNGNGNTAKASIVRVASETDFASRSEDFANLVGIVANGALVDADLEGIMKVVQRNNNGKTAKTVKDALDEAILAIRENLQIAGVEQIVASSKDSVLTGYVHGKVVNDSNAGTAAAVVELLPKKTECALSKEEIVEFGRKLAMHIVAAKPSYLNPEDVPAHVLEKEKQFLMEQMADTGKPPEILEKIVVGRMRKFYEEVCLMEQAHMLEEGNPKVSKALNDLGLELVTFKSNFIHS